MIIKVEVKHHDNDAIYRSEEDKNKVRAYIENYEIKYTEENHTEIMKNEIDVIDKKWPKCYSIKFYVRDDKDIIFENRSK